MTLRDLLSNIGRSLAALGARRLAALGLTAVTVFVLVGVSAYFLSRPRQEILYSGLDRQDVTRIGAALNDAGIGFDVSVGGDTVVVEYGGAARARMMLAQKGLPRSDSAGYELFDKLGSLGLTTFMQQVTKVRALEGELARTIQLIDGVKAARVHLALKSENNFRGNGDQATASVIIRSDREAGEHAANAVRHLVAAAIPGLAPSQVTVMSADGTILASTDDPDSASPGKLMNFERSLAADVEARIARTMAPLLGAGNIRISVSTKLNADRRQINETNFDPNSRVERSVRTIKESGEASNATGSTATTVEQNVPVEETPKGNGDNSNEKKDRKEELTNYEISSKSMSTTSDGYGIERLSIAVVINKPMLGKMLGEKPGDDAINSKISELQQLVASASGMVPARGDSLKIAVADFVDQETGLEPAAGTGIADLVNGNLGTIVNAGTLLLVTFLVLMLGLRPAVKVLISQGLKDQRNETAQALPDLSGVSASNAAMEAIGSHGNALESFGLAQLGSGPSDPVLDNLSREISNSPRDRLTKIVELDPDRAVEVLKQWLSEPTEQSA